MSRNPTTRRFYTIDEVAGILNVHPRTVRRYIDCGDLKSHKMGRSVRISDDDLRAYTALRRRA